MNASDYTWLRDKELALLTCLVPVYGSDGGNYTEVWLEDGRKFEVKNRIKTVVKNIMDFLAMSPRQSSSAWQAGGRRHAPPIVLGPHMTLVALPVRRPLFRDQGGIGYVVLQKIVSWEKKEEGDFRTSLVLAGGQRLGCLLKMGSLELRLMEANKIWRRSLKLFKELSRNPEPPPINPFYPDGQPE
ncbi:hypothetical protein V3F56_09165 [Moorellaceae bacterium AZ2]